MSKLEVDVTVETYVRYFGDRSEHFSISGVFIGHRDVNKVPKLKGAVGFKFFDKETITFPDGKRVSFKDIKNESKIYLFPNEDIEKIYKNSTNNKEEIALMNKKNCEELLKIPTSFIYVNPNDVEV